MDIGSNEQVEIVDLCTPKLEMSDLAATLPVVIPKQESSSTFDGIERCLKFDPRLCILPLYPMSDLLEQQYPLLPNIPCESTAFLHINLAYRLTSTELLRRCTGAFKPALDIIDSDSTIPS